MAARAASALLIAILFAVPAAAGPVLTFAQGECPVTWNMFPTNGPPHATKVSLSAVPSAATTLRIVGPAGADNGVHGQFRLGLGEAHTAGGGGGFSVRTGTWASMRNVFAATTSSGQAVAANQAIEFLFEGLSENTVYHWQVQCQSGGLWRPASLGRGRFKTIPAAGSAIDVVKLTMSDMHLMNNVTDWQGDDSTDSTDADGDGNIDEFEKLLQSSEAVTVILTQAVLGAHFIAELGDNAHPHCQDCPACNVEASPRGPCSTEDYQENYTGALRSLGYSSIPDTLTDAALWYDDEVELAEARFAQWANHTHAVLSYIAVAINRGNHEGATGFGDASGSVGHYVSSAAGATDPRRMDDSVRQAQRNLFVNPNDVEFYPTGCDGVDNGDPVWNDDPCEAGNEVDDWEEQGSYFAYETGEALFIHMDEYISTTAGDVDGDVMTAGTTLPVGECVAADDPLGCCSGVDAGICADFPNTPYDWDPGDAQELWFDNLMQNTTRKIVEIQSHHGFGGITVLTDYHYGRRFGLTRYCTDTSGSLIAVDTGSPLHTGHVLGIGALATDDNIPCFSYHATASNAANGWCDWANDRTDDDDAVCGETMATAISRGTFMGKWAHLVSEAQTYCARTGGIVIFQNAHDHMFYYWDPPFDDGCIVFVNTGQIGSGLRPGWHDSVWAEFFGDLNNNGVPDTRTAQYVKDHATQGHSETLDTADGSRLQGWEGKGFARETFGSDGCYTLEYISAAGHYHPPTSGQVVFTREVCGS